MVVFNQVIMLFVIMAIGFIAGKVNIVDKKMSKKLSDLLIYITMPLLIIISYQREITNELLNTAIIILVGSFCIHLFQIFISRIVTNRMKDPSKNVVRHAIAFANCGFMGFPVLASIYGDIGIFYGSIFCIAFNLIVWSYGYISFSDEKDMKKAVKKSLLTPAIISVVVGIVFFAFQIKIISPLYEALKSVGDMTTPLSMIIVGSVISRVKLKEIINDKRIYIVTVFRLLIIPFIVFGVLTLLKIKNPALSVCVLLSAMPAATNTTIFAEKFDGDAALASKSVAFTTLLSIGSIMLFLSLI